jgi:hypothetical protein
MPSSGGIHSEKHRMLISFITVLTLKTVKKYIKISKTYKNSKVKLHRINATIW